MTTIELFAFGWACFVLGITIGVCGVRFLLNTLYKKATENTPGVGSNGNMRLTDGDIETIYTQAMTCWSGVTKKSKLEIARIIPEDERQALYQAEQRFQINRLFGQVRGSITKLDTHQVGRFQMAYDSTFDVLIVMGQGG